MKALPPFERLRANYLDDEAFRSFQRLLMKTPEAGDVIQGTGGLRKIRFADERRATSDERRATTKRQAQRHPSHLLLVAGWRAVLAVYLYGKDVQDDLNEQQKKLLKRLLQAEIDVRTTP